MGNSRSSHNFSSSRSASLSDLPYKLASTSYNSKKSMLPGLNASSQPRENKLSTRSSSVSSLNDKTKLDSSSVTEKPAAVKRTSTIAVTRQRPPSSQPTPRQYPDSKPLGPRQFNNDYLQSDVKKLFKSTDKRYSQALIQNADDADDTLEGLDAKLAILKKQRSQEDVVDAVQVKKSRKSKKAPLLPLQVTNPDPKNKISSSENGADANHNTGSENFNNNKNSSSPKKGSMNEIKKPAGMARKRSAAPAPPKSTLKSAVSPPTKSPSNANGNFEHPNDFPNGIRASQPVSITVEETVEKNDKEKTVRETPLSSDPGKQSDPLSDEFTAVENALTHKQEVSPSLLIVTIKDETTTQSFPNNTESIEPSVQKTIIEREMFSSTKVSSNRKQSRAPPAPTTTLSELGSHKATKNSDQVLGIRLADEDTFTKALIAESTTAVEIKTEDGGISPVDIAVQCDQSLLAEEQQNGDQTGNIQKPSIKENAKKDCAAKSDESLPDNSTTSDEIKTICITKPIEIAKGKTDDALPPLTDKEQETTDLLEAERVYSHSTVDDKWGDKEKLVDETAPLPEVVQPKVENNTQNGADITQQSVDSAETEQDTIINVKTDAEEMLVDTVHHSTTDVEITDQPNCPTPQSYLNEQKRTTEADVSNEILKTDRSLLTKQPTEASDGVNIPKLQSKVEATTVEVSKHLPSPTSIDCHEFNLIPAVPSQDPVPDTHESSPKHVENSPHLKTENFHLNSSAQLQHLAPDSHDLSLKSFEQSQDLVGDPTKSASPSVTLHSSSNIFVPDVTDHSKETKKHKSKYTGIFRITKTMRRFMSSVGKPSKTHNEPEDVPVDEEVKFSTDNWVLADGNRKPTPRKEYKPTWCDEDAQNKIDLQEQPTTEADQKTTEKAELTVQPIDTELPKNNDQPYPNENWTLGNKEAVHTSPDDRKPEPNQQQEFLQVISSAPVVQQMNEFGNLQECAKDTRVELSHAEPDVRVKQIEFTETKLSLLDVPSSINKDQLVSDEDDQPEVVRDDIKPDSNIDGANMETPGKR
ncbi:enolase-phosphatase E1-like [Watersipora subatra]|uniref:enolase-phosphatase E1-like n=1 Tax=Watersipora subatra TaxID=2589382 RepID=UPI00355AD410